MHGPLASLSNRLPRGWRVVMASGCLLVLLSAAIAAIAQAEGATAASAGCGHYKLPLPAASAFNGTYHDGIDIRHRHGLTCGQAAAVANTEDRRYFSGDGPGDPSGPGQPPGPQFALRTRVGTFHCRVYERGSDFVLARCVSSARSVSWYGSHELNHP